MLKRAIDSLEREVTAYRKLSAMLDEQFRTAQRLDTVTLARVSNAIATEVERLDTHHRERARWLEIVSRAAQRQPAARGKAIHEVVEKRCAELKSLATHCKASTLRNGQLLASQFDTMQRVLRGERHTYAPD